MNDPIAEIQPPRRPLEPTPESRELVRNMAWYGLRDQDIGGILRISEASVKRHYREELDEGRSYGIYKAVRTLYQLAIGIPDLDARGKRVGWKERPDTKALRMLLESRGFTTSSYRDHGAGNAQESQHPSSVDLSGMSDEEIKVMEKAFARKLADQRHVDSGSAASNH